MATQSRLNNEQIEKIKATLQQSMGDDSAELLKSLEQRFSYVPDVNIVVSEEEEESPEPGTRETTRIPGQVNVPRLIQEGKVEKMVAAISAVRDSPQGIRMLVAAILRDGKAFQMVEALKEVRTDVELVNALVNGIVSKKGINPLIDALRHATESPLAMKALAVSIAEQGTINHIIRAIATVHKCPEVEVIWAMEIIAKGTVEQMLDALNLIDKESPGAIILSSGILSTKDCTLEQLVRALNASKTNPKASNVIAVELARRADVAALGTLLEKYLTDDTEAGEIVVAKLVHKGRIQQMVDASRNINTPSMSGKILAVGLVQKAPVELLLRAYRLLASNPQAKQIVGLEIVKKKGKLMAMRDLGGDVWDLVKNQSEIELFAQKAYKRYEWLLKHEIGEEVVITAEPKRTPPKPAAS